MFSFTITCRNADGESRTAEVTVEGRNPPKVSVQIVGVQPTFEHLPPGMGGVVERSGGNEVVLFNQLGEASFVYANEDSLCITVDALNGSIREYHPKRVCVRKANFNKKQTVVLTPLVWEGIKVDLVEVRDTAGTWPSAPGRSFYSWDNVIAHDQFSQIVTWSEEKLPIPVAYNRGLSTEDISEVTSDSIGKIIDELNNELGPSRTGKFFFKYGNFEDLNPQGNQYEGISLAIDDTTSSGFSVKRSDAYTIISGLVTMRSLVILLHGGGLKHELMHGLGVGHTQRWLSIMNNNPGWCGPARCFSPTSKDKMYVRLLHRMREVSLKYNAEHDTP
jgi:hypothetical protein